MEIIDYTPSMAERWNMLASVAPTGTFLHNRSYMDYHSDRFNDRSVMALDDKGRLVAELPACAIGDTIVSHAGLTYGGWLVDNRRLDTAGLLRVWEAAMAHYRAAGFKQLRYKPVPTIYHRYPAQDDIYCLFKHGATTEAVQISSAIDLTAPIDFDSNARRGMKKALSEGVTIEQSDSIDDFWAILTSLLRERYSTAPVHTPAEMKLLMSRFPENIRFYGAYHSGELVAGSVIYLTDTTAHAQYICASPEGKELRALPLLFHTVMQRYSATHRYFDFGISTEDGGRYLNEGLLRQKCGMGGRGIVYSTYSLPL